LTVSYKKSVELSDGGVRPSDPWSFISPKAW